MYNRKANNNNFMSKDKYVEQTLQLPSELLFNYNINFEGLRGILEGVNIKTNQNESQIKYFQEQLSLKLPTATFEQTEKKLNGSYLFGTKCQAYIDKTQAKIIKAHKTDVKDLGQLDQFCWKMNRMAEMVEYLMDKCEVHDEKINNDGKRNQKLIEESFRRLEDKLGSGTDSFSKTINAYFTQTNEKVAKLDSELNMLSKTHGSKIDDINGALAKRISQNNLKAALEAAQNKIKKDLEAMLKNDHMQRLSTVNELKQSFKEVEKDIDIKNKVANGKMQQLSDKVAKALQISSFDIEKHKIYERLSEMRNKTDDLLRRNNQFIQFRKGYLSNNEKNKQEMIGLQEEIKKMQNKEGSFKKLENMSDVINSLNPHLICEIGQQVKLHQKEIGKLEKMVVNLQNEYRNRAGERQMPEVNGGQNSDLVQKIIKQYMANLDFEGRLKRNEKQMLELRKKNDTFNELEKKIYALSKEMDIGAIMKELKRKCDEENTRKDTRILDGKIQQLFEFYKQLRREVEEKRKVISKNDSFENASLTTKRLLSANCISCSPSTSTKRQANRSRMDMSLDYSIEGQKNTIYSRLNK